MLHKIKRVSNKSGAPGYVEIVKILIDTVRPVNRS